MEAIWRHPLAVVASSMSASCQAVLKFVPVMIWHEDEFVVLQAGGTVPFALLAWKTTTRSTPSIRPLAVSADFMPDSAV